MDNTWGLVPNMKVRITERRRDHHTRQPVDSTFEALVGWAEPAIDNNDGKGPFVYFGWTPYDNRCGFGNSRWYKEPRPFGIQKLEFLGLDVPKPRRMPVLKGNPGYDLMM